NLIVPYYSQNRDFSYTCEDLMDYYEGSDIKALLLVNPDNPSGNFIIKSEILRLSEWAGQKDIRLIVDESFMDFADTSDSQTLLSEAILQENRHLTVIKSISKSFGVPGLRLGIAASADEDLITYLKKDIAIWNINSIAEFYLQICEKYSDDYRSALEKFKYVRAEFIEKLRSVPNLRLIPTQANFVMCEVLDGFSSENLSKILLYDHNILIKDLSANKGIDGQFIRVAIKTREENNQLIAALHNIFGKTSRTKASNYRLSSRKVFI
ncbi:MAG: histidinol-phosphate aminotransferase family protein, partial [Papillibacter sp.]|nr:histidinol-phosphate aminotransferase family protein [Papillibacter sp.]